MTLTVIGPHWTRTSRVLWCLEELGLPYDHEDHPPHSPPVKALNPLSQVPILKDGDSVLTDSVAILHYLADRAGKLTYPVATPERGMLDARIGFLVSELEVPLWMRNRHSYVLPEDMRHPEIFPILETDFHLAERKFVRLLGEDAYFAGPDFTIADIVATAILGWGDGAVGLKTDKAQDYIARQQARPAFRRARPE